jgi:hypothetical protein
MNNARILTKTSEFWSTLAPTCYQICYQNHEKKVKKNEIICHYLILTIDIILYLAYICDAN